MPINKDYLDLTRSEGEGGPHIFDLREYEYILRPPILEVIKKIPRTRVGLCISRVPNTSSVAVKIKVDTTRMPHFSEVASFTVKNAREEDVRIVVSAFNTYYKSYALDGSESGPVREIYIYLGKDAIGDYSTPIILPAYIIDAHGGTIEAEIEEGFNRGS